MAIYTEVSTCRIFPDQPLETFFELGSQPPANSLRQDIDELLPSIPLTLGWSEKAKSVQLTVNVSSEYLFKHYVWVTGTSKTARDYAEYFAEQFLQRLNHPKLFMLEIASNDGTFLRPFIQRELNVLGVDPAQNIAATANAAGIPTVAEFFNLQTATKIRASHGQCQGLMARNVIPHVEHIHSVMEGIVHLLSDDGIAAFEFHYAGKIFDELHYDSIYHEHLFYHSLTSMQHLLSQYGFTAFDLFQSPISGGSYVLFFTKENRSPTTGFIQALAKEQTSGINDKQAWLRFAEASREHAASLLALIEKELAQGKRIIGYGASARSSTLLNFAGIDKRHLCCIADKSDYKHHRYTAGTDILILAPDEALATKPDTILLLAWNFEAEIMAELRDQYGFRGKVIIPLPGPVREVWLNDI
jgi:hypothetical protein